MLAASDNESNVNFSGRHFPGSSYGAFGRIFVAGVVLALVLQGAHVCPPAAPAAAGILASLSASSPVCPVCAVAHTLLLTLLLIFFSLVPTRSRMLLVAPPVRPLLRALRLDLRAPPAL